MRTISVIKKLEFNIPVSTKQNLKITKFGPI